MGLRLAFLTAAAALSIGFAGVIASPALLSSPQERGSTATATAVSLVGPHLPGRSAGSGGSPLPPDANIAADAARAPEGRVMAVPPADDTTGDRNGPQTSSGTWVWPVRGKPAVSRRFDPPRVKWGSGHRGVDLVTAVGSRIQAPAAGTVSFAGLVAGREVLVVAHADGLRSTLEPVSATLPTGAVVGVGDDVGILTGAPGHCSPAACLHWGVLRGSEYLDPLRFLQPPVVLLPVP